MLSCASGRTWADSWHLTEGKTSRLFEENKVPQQVNVEEREELAGVVRKVMVASPEFADRMEKVKDIEPHGFRTGRLGGRPDSRPGACSRIDYTGFPGAILNSSTVLLRESWPLPLPVIGLRCINFAITVS